MTKHQSDTLNRCEATCLRIILEESYVSHEAACEMLGLTKLSDRRLARCHRFSRQCLEHPQNKRIFPKNPEMNQLRSREPYKVNFGYTESYRRSTIPFCQRLLNTAAAQEMEEEEERKSQE